MMVDEPHSPSVRWIELAAIVVILMILAAMLFPAIFYTRQGQPRRTHCLDNLKNVALALQNYHDVYKTLPPGVTHAGSPENPRVGPSWWYSTLPFLESRNIYDKIERTQGPEFESAGSPCEFTFADMPNSVDFPVQDRLRDFQLEFMHCPSSPLPLYETRNGPIAMSSYVGIAGACDIDPDSTDFDGCPNRPESAHVYRNRNKGTGPNQSIVTSSGLLPPNQQIRMAQCSDGTSNTMIVGEQSGFLYHRSPNIETEYHGDPGWNPPSEKNPSGWLSGTNKVGPVGQAAGWPDDSQPSDWHAELLLNITTVRYAPNLNRVLGENPYPGCAEVMGHNNPLQSPHPGGMFVAMLDGSVQFISAKIDLAVLLRLANREDGQIVEIE